MKCEASPRTWSVKLTSSVGLASLLVQYSFNLSRLGSNPKRQYIGIHKPIPRNRFSALYRNGITKHRAVIDEAMKLSILSTRINLGWKLAPYVPEVFPCKGIVQL